MFSDNPFAGLADSVAPAVMQAFVVVMIALVVLGTLYDLAHKRSAAYFFDSRRKSREKATKQLGGGEMASLLVQTAAVDVLTSGEFCNQRRRIAHLLGMYGFAAYAITTVIMVFGYPTADGPTPAVLPRLWHIGALMVCIGGYWFWFFLRADVSAEGNSPFRLVRADLFVLSLVANTTLALIWSWLQAGGSGWATVFLALYVISTVVLFGGVPWSKFSHMFYKPAAAFQKRVEDANGFGSNLPRPADKPATFGSARRPARHY
ncbi:MAG TPA: hypothetical protein VKR31_13125 [Rhizomicrobium sp.]|nr:hypothetical protein [Rhizomicrobium sp.]